MTISPAPVHRLVGRIHRRSKAKKKICQYIGVVKYLLKKVRDVPISIHRDFDDEEIMDRINELIKKDEAELNPPNAKITGPGEPAQEKHQ